MSSHEIIKITKPVYEKGVSQHFSPYTVVVLYSTKRGLTGYFIWKRCSYTKEPLKEPLKNL